MAAARLFLALLLLSAATAAFAHADEGRAFDITTAASVPRKVLNGGSEGLLASAASQAVSAVQSVLEVIESAMNLHAPVLDASYVNGVAPLSGLDNFKKVINSGKKVVVMFTATWCGPCKAIGPFFQRWSNEYEGAALAFYMVDADDNEDIVAFVGIKSIPAFIAFKDGDKIDSLSGANPPALQKMIQRLAE